MKIVLGINAYHADASSCILIDGKLIAAVEEERINRKKHFSGYPDESIKECLKIANIKDIEITDVAFNTKPLGNLAPKINFFVKNLFSNKNYLKNKINKKVSIKQHLIKNFKLNKRVKFHYVEHHLAHIASAFYPSGFKDAIGLSIDGSGDFTTLAIAECNQDKIKINHKVHFPDSLGIFYHGMTQFLGYENYGDEYKIMGLAAYGEPKYFHKIKDNLFIENDNKLFELNLKYFNHQKTNFKYIADETLSIGQIYSSNLLKLFSTELKKSENAEQFNKDFASSVQKVYEFFFKKIIQKLITTKFSNNLVFAGGCALNSSANKILTDDNGLFDKIYIPFAPGDNGGALGAAFIVSAKYHNKIENIKTPYLGRDFSDLEIIDFLKSESSIRKFSYEYFKSDDLLCKFAAKLISEGNVIGWFQGKMEFGPRALGNRSILADPRNPNMKNIINMKIKRRESFRPFAPSVLKEFQSIWFNSNFSSPYMSSLAEVKNEKKNLIPAVTHIDGTARLQSVDLKHNHRYATLIKHFNLLTGVPVLLNTSFNENEPIVMTPKQAIECLLRTDMDALFISNFLIKKV
tara:strand:+ start:2683 stop:4410 length:1728 start_codon:yes stop_codon:yes gene_type:complete